MNVAFKEQWQTEDGCTRADWMTVTEKETTEWIVSLECLSGARTEPRITHKVFHTIAPHEETTRQGSLVGFRVPRAAGREVILPKLQFNTFKRRLDLHISF